MTLTDGLIVFGAGVGAALVVGIGLLVWRKRAGGKVADRAQIDVIAEHVRAVGKLVGLEVSAKEIATVTKGWSWMPPLLLSQARLAMIFHFEKQYFIDVTRIGAGDVRDLGDGRFELTLPPIQGQLRLTNVNPYDIQDGRVLGLLDVIQMNAATQKQLMERAQDQAGELFETNDARYQREARQSLERQLTAMLALFDARVTIAWREDEAVVTAPLQADPGVLALPSP